MQPTIERVANRLRQITLNLILFIGFLVSSFFWGVKGRLTVSLAPYIGQRNRYIQKNQNNR